jgi:hypothetical protein
MKMADLQVKFLYASTAMYISKYLLNMYTEELPNTEKSSQPLSSGSNPEHTNTKQEH